MRFRKKGKLSPSHVSKYPLELVRMFGDVAYRLALPLNLLVFHHMFHVLILKRYCHNDSHVIQWNSVALNQDLSCEEEPISILDRTKKGTTLAVSHVHSQKFYGLNTMIMVRIECIHRPHILDLSNDIHEFSHFSLVWELRKRDCYGVCCGSSSG
ncbi:hypothetical protein MTR67_031362 [Solanum verrucosum]|uniref:Tf2-1-like SH3-like domain-containing protein n=1 Tax=Solanum verrucosum TaxID=315347 RepID=A0AAF0U2E0_SOLVR|nr:hypothetical protein MTR67_031362 [Solanum verrucosum]